MQPPVFENRIGKLNGCVPLAPWLKVIAEFKLIYDM